MFATILALVMLGAATLSPVAADRARDNYEALLKGEIQLRQLTPSERAEILALLKMLRDDRSPSERCFEEQLERAGGSPTRLDQEVIDLKCRPLGTGLQ